MTLEERVLKDDKIIKAWQSANWISPTQGGPLPYIKEFLQMLKSKFPMGEDEQIVVRWEASNGEALEYRINNE